MSAPTLPAELAPFMAALPEARAAATHQVEMDPKDQERLGRDWNRAVVDVAFKANRPLVDRDYAKDKQIAKDLKEKSPTKTDPTQAEIDAERTRREGEQKAAQSLDETVIAQQIVSQDGHPLKGRPVDDADVKAAAAKEKTRREKLGHAYDVLYAAHDTRMAYQKAAEKAVADAQQKKEAEAIAAAQAKKGATPLDATEIDAAKAGAKLTDAERDTASATIKKSDYYDEDTRTYYLVKPDGTFETDASGKKTAVETESYKPVYEELTRLRDGKEGPPIDQTSKDGATNILKTLKYNEVDNKFDAKTTEQALQEEIEADQKQAAKQLLLELDGRIGTLPADIFTKDAAGNITGVDQNKLNAFREKLAKEPVDETTGRWILYLGSYYEAKDPKAKARLSALIYHELKNNAPDRLKTGFTNSGRFETTIGEIITELENQYHIKVRDRSSIFNDAARKLALAMACQNQLEIKSNRYVIPERVEKLLQKKSITLTSDEREFIIEAAGQEGDIAEQIFTNVFCLNTSALSNQEVRRRYADNVIDKMLDEKGLSGASRDAHKAAYTEVANRHVMTDDELKNIAKRFYFHGNLGNILTLGLILGPLGLSVMGFDVTDDER